MAITSTKSPLIRAITTCVPPKKFDNLADATSFPEEEIKKVVRMAGVKTRHMADDSICSSDLCLAAAQDTMSSLNWAPDSIDGLIFVTQSPDYFLPSTACLIHRDLDLSPSCAAFDVGLGCSGYPYGIWLASTMLQNPGFQRILVLHGETPTRFSSNTDRAVALLFGDAGSATALEASDKISCDEKWWFSLNTDGKGYSDLIIKGGGFRNRFPDDKSDCYVAMNGTGIFNFTINRVPALVKETMAAAQVSDADIDYYIFHQSNQFIMNHLMNKIELPKDKIPLTINEFGSAGGPSVPLTITKGGLNRSDNKDLSLLLVGYGVGLSWGSALVSLPPEAVLNHLILPSFSAISKAR